MKNSSSTTSSLPFFMLCSTQGYRWLLAVACFGQISSVALAQVKEMNIGVRTTVTDKSNIWTRGNKAAPGTGGHSKVYGILSVDEVKADVRLVRPVDESMILRTLSAEMNKHGFKLFTPGRRPDILITVSYGRGEMQNPYIRDTGYTGGDYRAGAFLSADGKIGTANDAGAPTVVITGAFAQQLVDEKGFGYEAKLQKAAYEKLHSGCCLVLPDRQFQRQDAVEDHHRR